MKHDHKFSAQNACLLLAILSFYLAYFYPITGSNRLLAFGDGVSYYLPNFYAGISLWDQSIASGFPMAADPQAMTWYPLRILLSSVTNTWNLFVILAYVLASYFTYLYVRFVAQSFLGGVVAGIVYGLSGFMAAHLDHTSIIHSAIWLPLILLAIEKCRVEPSSTWFVVGALGFSLCALAGHPQIYAYTVVFCCCYAVITGFSSTTATPQWKFYLLFGGMLLLSLSLAAIQLLPTIELGELSLRRRLTYTEFNSYALPVRQILGLIFPFLFGGSAASIYGHDYFGQWNHGELAGYAGLTALILAFAGVNKSSKHLIKWFYAAVALGALLLAFGDATPLAEIVYRVPGLNKFRAPARHLLEYTFAVSVLAGLGAAAIKKQSTSTRIMAFPVLACSGLILLALISVYLQSKTLQAMALNNGIEHISFLPWSNPALSIPLAIFGLAVFSVLFWSAKPAGTWRQVFLVVALIIDLGSYAWFVSVLHLPAASRTILARPSWTEPYLQQLQPYRQRITPARGWGILSDIPPNVSRLWGIASTGFYGPLGLSHVSRLLQMSSTGYVYAKWFDETDQTLDMLAVRYVFAARPELEALSYRFDDNKKWAPEDIRLRLGTGCGNYRLRKEVTLDLPQAFLSTGIGIVSYLTCSKAIKNDEGILEITSRDSFGHVRTKVVRAGRDTAEWAFDREDVRPFMKHNRARIFDNKPYGSGDGHRYFSYLQFSRTIETIQVQLKWIGTSGAATIDKLTLLNEQDKSAYPIKPIDCSLALDRRWRKDRHEASTQVYENLRAMPRVWLVPEVVSARPAEILTAIHTSTLPDGRLFDCSRIALVDEALQFKVEDFDRNAKAEILDLNDMKVEIETSADSPSFLVLSGVYYPGWSVSIDGKTNRLFRTNYILRGAVVPAGRHKVCFRFTPITFYIGLAISVLGLLVTGAILLVGNKKR